MNDLGSHSALGPRYARQCLRGVIRVVFDMSDIGPVTPPNSDIAGCRRDFSMVPNGGDMGCILRRPTHCFWGLGGRETISLWALGRARPRYSVRSFIAGWTIPEAS